MFIDSHCHLDKVDLSPYSGDFQKMLDAALERKIKHMLCVSIDLDDFPNMYQLIQPYPYISASVGVHPLHVNDEIASIEQLVELSQQDKIVALGETGLDYHYQQDTKAAQQESFHNHLRASAQTKLPTIIHTRDAREDTIDIIRESGDIEVGGVLHCFTENLAMAKKGLDLNYYISFSGIISFRNAEELREVVKAVPLDKILIETDSPYLAPVPYRGKKNEPKYVLEVAQVIADIKGVSLEQIAAQTQENFYQLFKQANY